MIKIECFLLLKAVFRKLRRRTPIKVLLLFFISYFPQLYNRFNW